MLGFVGTVSVKPLQLLARNKAANTRRQMIVGILMRRRIFALLRAAAFVMVLVRVGRNGGMASGGRRGGNRDQSGNRDQNAMVLKNERESNWGE